MMKSTGLSADILAMLTSIFKNHPSIEQVKLYGSRAKGTFNERSDVDLVAYGSDLNRFLIADVLLDLDDSNIPYTVDLQSFHDLKNRQLIDHIDRVGVIIYSMNKDVEQAVGGNLE